MEDENDNDAMSSLSDSSQKKGTQTQTPKRNQNDKSKSDRKKKEKADQQFDKVKKVWNSHSDWLRHSGYAQPQVVESIFPQFFADIKDRENLRIAQMFCLPMAAMK